MSGIIALISTAFGSLVGSEVLVGILKILSRRVARTGSKRALGRLRDRLENRKRHLKKNSNARRDIEEELDALPKE